jgi:O-methyltransferase
MIGEERMLNIQKLAWELFENEPNQIPGDFMECGVWRGGAAIFMRAILAQLDEDDGWMPPQKCVWVADSFAGLPAPNPAEYPADEGDTHHLQKPLAVSLETVKANFARYGLLDDRVKFLPGFFKDSLPGPVEKLALLRIDADMHESTTQALEAMYPKLSPGGFVIIDDYFNIPNCHKAVNDFRERNLITEPIQKADSWCAIYWRKS